MGFRALSPRSGDTIGWQVQGRLTEADVERMHGQLDAILSDTDAARVLVELTSMEGVEPSAVWEDLKRSFGKVERIQRMAVVGDARWQQLLADASESLAPVEARAFEPDHVDAAWSWLER